jgi:outer membrane protein
MEDRHTMRAPVCFTLAVCLAALALLGAAGDAPPPTDLLTLYLKATEFDPVYLSAISERQIADQSLKESRSAVLPSLSANVGSSYTQQDIKSSDNALFRVGTNNYYNQTYSISLTQTVLHFDSFQRIPQAKAEVRRAEAQLEAAEQDLILRLAEAHFNFLAARDALEFATAERTANWQQVQEAEQKLGSGLVKLPDVEDARARYAVSQAAETTAVDAVEESRQAIAEITGEAPAALKQLSESFPLVAPDQPDIDKWVESGFFQNPTLRALQVAVEIAQDEVKKQRAAYLPTLDLVASYNDNNSGGSIYAGGGGNNIATGDIGLRLGIPIFDGGRNSALTTGAALKVSMAEQELERGKRRVERLARTSFQGVMSGITRVDALGKSVFSHQAAMVAKEEGWRSGLNTGLAVLDARKEFYQSKRDRAVARYTYIMDSLRLKQAAGVLNAHDLEQINAYLQ